MWIALVSKVIEQTTNPIDTYRLSQLVRPLYSTWKPRELSPKLFLGFLFVALPVGVPIYIVHASRGPEPERYHWPSLRY